jgi:hypothetical protein
MLEMARARLYGFWGSLTEGLRTPQPQNEARHGDNKTYVEHFAGPDSMVVGIK